MFLIYGAAPLPDDGQAGGIVSDLFFSAQTRHFPHFLIHLPSTGISGSWLESEVRLNRSEGEKGVKVKVLNLDTLRQERPQALDTTFPAALGKIFP